MIVTIDQTELVCRCVINHSLWIKNIPMPEAKLWQAGTFHVRGAILPLTSGASTNQHPFALHPTTHLTALGLSKVSTVTPGLGAVVEYLGDYLGTASFAHACAVAVGFHLPGWETTELFITCWTSLLLSNHIPLPSIPPHPSHQARLDACRRDHRHSSVWQVARTLQLIPPVCHVRPPWNPDGTLFILPEDFCWKQNAALPIPSSLWDRLLASRLV